MTDPTFEQDLRDAFREAVDQQAPASLRASVVAMPDMFPAPTERSSIGHRMLSPRNLLVPIGLAAVVVVMAIGLGIIMRPWTNVGNPSPLPGPSSGATRPPTSSSVTGNMTSVRQGHQAVLLADGRVLVTGGSTIVGGQDPLSAELYNPDTGTWTPTASTKEERPTLTLLADGRVLATGGNEPGFNSAPVASAEVYDPETGEWSATGSMTTPRSSHTATLLADGTVLVAGSWGPDDVANAEASAELYDPDTGTWSATGSMIEVRYEHTATLMADGKVLVAGGIPSNLTAELYDPVTGKWSATGRMPGAHALHTATLLLDGTVLVVGGESMRGGRAHLEDAADLYDPTTGTWSATGSMTEYRLYHAATLLPDGRLLVTGGSGGEDGNRATAELYDPDTRTWSLTNGMAAARSWHTATLLVDGKILLAGGEYGLEPLASAELYDPGAGP